MPGDEDDGPYTRSRAGPVARGSGAEVIAGVGPAFGTELSRTFSGLSHDDVLAAILTGIAEEGIVARIVKVYHSSDCAVIGHVASHLSGSGIGIGIQSKGTTVIHKRGLAVLNNLELFSQSPSLTLETYRNIGRNAAKYAQGKSPKPVGVKIDSGARLRLIVTTTLLHRRETEAVRPNQPYVLTGSPNYE
jgi:propanediol dehydratase medium subunit